MVSTKEIDEQYLESVKDELAKQLSSYISIIKEEYGNLIPKEILKYLNSIDDYRKIIKITQTNTISMFVRNGVMYFPLNALKIINVFKKIIGHGSNRNHKTYTKDTLIINNNTFFSYIKHVFVAGLTPLEFYEETLLHETTHLCGIDGATALREGFAELKTRELAQKYNLKTSACGYPKEVKIAFELQNIFGKEICDRIAFARNNLEITELLSKMIDEKASKFYIEVQSEMEKSFRMYYSKKYDGITGPIKKALEYKKINYDNVYKIINDYKEKN